VPEDLHDENVRRPQAAGRDDAASKPSADALRKIPPELRLGRVLRWVASGLVTPETAVALLAESTREGPAASPDR